MIEEVSYVNISFLKPYNLAMDYIEKIYSIQQNLIKKLMDEHPSISHVRNDARNT